MVVHRGISIRCRGPATVPTTVHRGVIGGRPDLAVRPRRPTADRSRSSTRAATRTLVRRPTVFTIGKPTVRIVRGSTVFISPGCVARIVRGTAVVVIGRTAVLADGRDSLDLVRDPTGLVGLWVLGVVGLLSAIAGPVALIVRGGVTAGLATSIG